MNLDELAALVIDAFEAEGIEYMFTGAFAYNLYGIPRATNDIDVVVSIAGENPVQRIVSRLSPAIKFDPQIQFDTLTWGRRRVGSSRFKPPFSVELFELFDDPFVLQQFQRKRMISSQVVGRSFWLPTAEDLIVQKLRWGRSKDLDDARDVLAVQGEGSLDMKHIRRWCSEHETIDRLNSALGEIPPLS